MLLRHATKSDDVLSIVHGHCEPSAYAGKTAQEKGVLWSSWENGHVVNDYHQNADPHQSEHCCDVPRRRRTFRLDGVLRRWWGRTFVGALAPF